MNWGQIAKIGGYVAAPFTGGASIPIGQMVGNVLESTSARTGGAAKGAADERTNRNQFATAANKNRLDQYGTQQQALLQALLAQDRGAVDRYQTRQGATSSALSNQSAEALARAKLGLEAPNVRARQSVLGSLMQNMQPVSVQASSKVAPHVPKISGGLTPAALDPMTRQHGGELMKAALQAQLSGSDIPAATNFMGGVLDAPESTDFRSGILKPPEMEGYKEAGKGESLLAGGSLVGGILGDLLKVVNNQRGGAPEQASGGYGGDYGPATPWQFDPRNMDVDEMEPD